MSKPLPKSQQDLLDALHAGVHVPYMPYRGTFTPAAYYYRADTHRRVTAAANALIAKGLARKVDEGRRRALALTPGKPTDPSGAPPAPTAAERP